MLNIGGGELLIILLVALIFLGPTRLPEVARQFGQTVASLRSMASSFQAELEAAAAPDNLVGPPPATPQTQTNPEDIARAAREVAADPFANKPGSVSAGGPTDLRSDDSHDLEADEEE